MSQWMMRVGTTLALVALTAGVALASPQKPKSHAKSPAKSAAAVCPVCRMPLTKRKTAMNTVAVKYHGSVMYCCSKCKMLPTMLVKPGGAHKGGHMGGHMGKKK